MIDLKAIYEDEFFPHWQEKDQEWFADYKNIVERALSHDETSFRSPDFQKELWDQNLVASAGPGNSVNVQGAFTDEVLIERLWALRERNLPSNADDRAGHLQAEFNWILDYICQRHASRQPKAKLVRLFATLLPHHVFCLLTPYWTLRFERAIEIHRFGKELIESHVLGRKLLLEQLSDETTLEAAIRQSQFSWWLAERHSRKENEDTSPGPVNRGQEERATALPMLWMLPADAQRKGIPCYTQNLALLKVICSVAENGSSRQELITLIQQEQPNLMQKTAANIISQAVALGLLSWQNNTYQTTEDGQSFLEAEAAHEVLVPLLVRKVFGFAQVLHELRKAEGPSTLRALARDVQSYNENWTTDRTPRDLISWALTLDIADADANSGTISLNEKGEDWAAAIPSDLSPWTIRRAAPPSLIPTDEDPDREVTEENFVGLADFASLKSKFDDSRLILEDYFLEKLHAALHSLDAKRFVLLSGLSGTGKSSIAREYAEAYCGVLDLPPREHFQLTAVWPDWTDPTGLLGFVNPLSETPTYHQTQTLEFLLKARDDPLSPYFLCLDEMNLARVEHYFAPFLSAMEGRSGRLQIHGNSDPVDSVPPDMGWPANLFILGTVNMDETTHAFSDKVLDRAFTFEFWDVDHEQWRSQQEEAADAEVLDPVYSGLREIYEALVPCRRHFGYRTFDEVLHFCLNRPDQLPIEDALDAAVLAKVLPKIRGEKEGALPNGLDEVANICTRHHLSRSLKKVKQMQEALAAQGFVRFWS